MYTVIENQYLHSLRSHGWEYYTPREYFLPPRSKSFDRAPTDPFPSLSLPAFFLIALSRNPRVGSRLSSLLDIPRNDLQRLPDSTIVRSPTACRVRSLGFISSRYGSKGMIFDALATKTRLSLGERSARLSGQSREEEGRKGRKGKKIIGLDPRLLSFASKETILRDISSSRKSHRSISNERGEEGIGEGFSRFVSKVRFPRCYLSVCLRS